MVANLFLWENEKERKTLAVAVQGFQGSASDKTVEVDIFAYATNVTMLGVLTQLTGIIAG